MKKLFMVCALLLFASSVRAENCCDKSTELTYSLSGSALLWDADEEGLDFVYVNEQGNGSLIDGSLRHLSPKWNCGYRVEAETVLPCYGLDLGAAWTHFSSHARKSAEVPFGGALFSVWSAPNTLTSPTVGEGEWDLRLNTLLFEAGKSFCISPQITLTPHVGLICAWINQSIDFNFSGGVGVGGSYPVLDDKIRMKNDYWGIGLRAGLNGRWEWTRCLGLYAKGALSILNGRFHIEQNESVLFDGVNGYQNLLGVSDKYYRARVLAELGLGLYWETQIRSCLNFALQIGWEQLYFFGQNQLNRYTTQGSPGIHAANDGDLSLQGVTVRGTFFF